MRRTGLAAPALHAPASPGYDVVDDGLFASSEAPGSAPLKKYVTVSCRARLEVLGGPCYSRRLGRGHRRPHSTRPTNAPSAVSLKGKIDQALGLRLWCCWTVGVVVRLRCRKKLEMEVEVEVEVD